MIREYEFAALVYDEQTHEIRCASCGKPVAKTKCLYMAGGRWVCGKCLRGFDNIPTQCTLCSTAKDAVEQ